MNRIAGVAIASLVANGTVKVPGVAPRQDDDVVQIARADRERRLRLLAIRRRERAARRRVVTARYS